MRRSVRDAYIRYNPKVIYITTSCASGIIGDDVHSVADEMKDVGVGEMIKQDTVKGGRGRDRKAFR